MELEKYIHRLRVGIDVVSGLVNVDDDQARWKPSPDRWSVLEIVNHLADEEVEDFRFRVETGITAPSQTWPTFNSWEWIESRQYNRRNLAESVQRFRNEREKSLDFLASVGDVAWDVRPPQPGNLRVGDVMVSWVAHDLFHVRQITVLLWEHLGKFARPYSTEYAGEF